MHQPGIPVDSFDWNQYLKLAQEIASDATLQATQESKWRCAISRAYYAAFHKARLIAFPQGSPETKGIHWLVAEELKTSSDKRRVQLGIDLDRLKGSRTKADYHPIIKDNLRSLAENVLIEAEEMIDKFNAL